MQRSPSKCSSFLQLHVTHRTLLACSFVEMDGAGKSVDQRWSEEVRRREVEVHLPEIPLPEPHVGDDQGSLADHEKAGDALKLGATGSSVQNWFCFFWFCFERLTRAVAAVRLQSSSLMHSSFGILAFGTRDCCSR